MPVIEWRDISPQFCEKAAPRGVLCSFVNALASHEPSRVDSEYQDEVERARRDALASQDRWPLEWRAAMAAGINVMADMARQGWRFRLVGSKVETSAPVAVEVGWTRDDWRARLHAQRNEQLREPATRTFVREMERGRYFKGERVSIFSLMRDGRDLAAKLRGKKNGSGAYLREAVSPYLEFASTGALCKFTGLPLLDIWRYFRHTWANPYQSIPGRSMVFLIRDAAAPFHPVMGIGALSSASVKMKARDEYIGWEPEQVIAELERQPYVGALKWMRQSVLELLDGIFVTDLLEDQFLSRRDLRKPSLAVIEALEQESEKQRQLHQKLMAQGDYKKSIIGEDEEADANWEAQARMPLFRSKRAAELAALLKISQALSMVTTKGRAGLVELLSHKSGREAMTQLIRRIKAMRVGTAIADLTVCGAVPPYQAILGGKLAAMLAASPEVVAAYRQRYERSASVIASSMAGRAVYRRSDLVFLGTTSLYGKRPCQYDRVTVPLSVVGGHGEGAIRYDYIAATEGWGTFQFGKATTRSLGEFVRSQRNGVQVNYIFGEGANPKLRALRDGLAMLGFDQETLLNHGMGRLIYGVRLAANTKEYLLGIEKRAKYFVCPRDVREATHAIGDWWMQRWVIKRLERQETLTEIERHTLIHPITHGARVQLPDDDLWQTKMF